MNVSLCKASLDVLTGYKLLNGSVFKSKRNFQDNLPQDHHNSRKTSNIIHVCFCLWSTGMYWDTGDNSHASNMTLKTGSAGSRTDFCMRDFHFNRNPPNMPTARISD